jgi:carbamoylphosphate synthase large subunit
LATRLEKALLDNPVPAASGKGVCRILGTPPDSIDAAEDRERWQAILVGRGGYCPRRHQTHSVLLFLKFYDIPSRREHCVPGYSGAHCQRNAC